MQIQTITPKDALWPRVIAYAQTCSWQAGKALAKDMKNETFTDWERVIAATQGEDICGYCTVAKVDCIPDVPYTPYIGFVFVGEAYRGQRLSQRMIEFAMGYLKSVGFEEVYLTSDHENLYEKYGFEVIDRKRAFWGGMEKIYRRNL